eukprot:COSAG01_NODE_4392_length_5071_cov_14.381738_5_plen_48_part_00
MPSMRACSRLAGWLAGRVGAWCLTVGYTVVGGVCRAGAGGDNGIAKM